MTPGGWRPFRNPFGSPNPIEDCPVLEVSLRWSGLRRTASGLAVVDTGADRSVLDVEAVFRQLAPERPPLERVNRDLQPWCVRLPQLSWGDSWVTLPEEVRIEACASHRGEFAAFAHLDPPLAEPPGPEMMILGRDIMCALRWMLVVDHERQRFAILSGSPADEVRQIVDACGS